MSKTPLQTAIEQIQKNAKYTALHYQSACDDCIAILTDLLPTERDVIEDAYKMGTIYGDINDSETYFTTKFNDNEHTKS